MLLVFFQTSLAQHLSTTVDLLWFSGHTQADQTEEVIRRWLQKLMIIAFQISNTGCHDVATVEHMLYSMSCDSHVILYLLFSTCTPRDGSWESPTLQCG